MIALRTAAGGRVDRSKPISFTFDGIRYAAFAGDTLASGLLANGVHLVGRSFKYHRPRGLVAAGSEEPNGLVTVIRDAARYTPNLRATQVELHDGLVAHSQNRWPSLARDAGRINDWLSRFFPAGFYYKTFMWPAKAWKSLYEPVIRSAAGLGKSPSLADPDRYAQRYAHCDVLVVGAGPAGLAAALAAAATGARVIVCDEQAEFGGSLLDCPGARIDGTAAADWAAQARRALAENSRVTLLERTTAFGYFPHNFIGINQRLTEHLAAPAPGTLRERLWQVRAARVILAAGAIERPLVFPGNDRPGILLAGAARTYLHRYGVRVGTRAVIVTAHDAAYQTALTLRDEAGLVFVHPFDDLDVMAGQGTIALEMLEDAPDLEILPVPIGGGGLISGVATAAKAMKPDIHIIGHWTYPTNTVKAVYVAANHCDSVELSVNGKSLGVNTKPPSGYIYAFSNVTFAPGVISAVGKANGQVVAHDEIETAGAPAALKLTPHTGPDGLQANGSDVAFFDVEVVDAQGRRCPTDEARVDFKLDGPAIWRGGYNSGKPHSINNLYLDTECGINRVAIRSTLKDGLITLTATRDGLTPATVTLQSAPVTIADGLMQ